MTSAPALELRNICKTFGATTVVNGIDLTVRPGEFLTLLGPSGCGKTTTLNLVAGFLTPDGGAIHIDGRDMAGVAPFRRDIGLVFQDYALFPHRTVAENVAFGLRMRHVAREEMRSRVAEMLDLVQLGGLADRRPQQLSGGQRQRVALARALVIRPTLLLLDEPLSNLDLKLREDMRLEIAALQRRLGITTILVTHDQSEALVMSDRIAVMSRGEIAQIDDPATIYARPVSRFVAGFIGAMNFLPCEIAGHAAGTATIRYDGAGMTAPAPGGVVAGEGALLAFRPERARLGHGDGTDVRLHGRLERKAFLGGRTELHLTLTTGDPCVIEIANAGCSSPAPGDDVAFVVAPDDCLIYPRAGAA